MKKIKIENYDEPIIGSIYTRDKLYWVWLGNRVKRSFANRKHAEAFLVEVSRFLNQCTFELNLIYVEIFSEYRRLWFYFDKKAIESFEMDRIMTWVNKNFDLLIGTSGINGNFNSFRNCSLIIDNLNEIIQNLKNLHLSRNKYAELYTLEVCRRRLQKINDELENFGKEQ